MSTMDSPSGTVPFASTGSVFGDFVGFLYGAPFLLDLDEISDSSQRPYTLLFNRILLFSWSPYYLVVGIFLSTTFVHILQNMYAKTCSRNTTPLSVKLDEISSQKGALKSKPPADDIVSTRPCSDNDSEVPSPKAEDVSAAPKTLASMQDLVAVERLEKEEPATWTIYGKTYDLSKFMESHPGGTWPLVLSKNSDCTILFESYHVFIDREKLGKMMARYEVDVVGSKNRILKSVENPRLSLPKLDPLYADLKQFCRDYFGTQRIARQKQSWLSWAETLTIGRPHNFTLKCITVMFASLCLSVYFQYKMVFHGEPWAALLFPFASWLLGVGLGHDSSHFASFSDHRLNRLVGWFSTAPAFFNSTAWTIQHVIQHHCFTNTFDDVDIFHFLPLIRNSRLFSKFGNHMRFQLPLLIFLIPTTSLHLSIAVPMDLILGTPVFIGPFDSSVPDSERFQVRYWQCRHLKSLMKDLWKPMLAEVSYVFLFWSVTIFNLGLIKALLFFMLVTVISSTLFITYTQPAHLNESAMKNVEENVLRKTSAGGEERMKPDEIAGYATLKLHDLDDLVQRNVKPASGRIEKSNDTDSNDTLKIGRWVREQVAYTVDCDTESFFTYLVSGGLNMQSIHHVLPIISHSHYQAMYPQFQRILAKHGVYTKVTRDWTSFLSDWFKWVQILQVESPEELDWSKKES